MAFIGKHVQYHLSLLVSGVVLVALLATAFSGPLLRKTGMDSRYCSNLELTKEGRTPAANDNENEDLGEEFDWFAQEMSPVAVRPSGQRMSNPAGTQAIVRVFCEISIPPPESLFL